MHLKTLQHVALFSICLAFVSHAADKTVTSKDGAFEIKYPDTWMIVDSAPGCVTGLSPVAAHMKGSTTFTVIFTGEDNVPLKDFTARRITANKATPNFNLVEQTEFKLGETTGVKLTYLWDVGAPAPTSKFVEYVLVTAKHTYSMTAATSKDDYEHYAPELDAILKSIKLADAK